jgi:hypothetical protein
LIAQLSEICYIVGAIVFILVLILFSIIYVEERIRKSTTKVKMGLVEGQRSFSGDNLPERAIERMLRTIERAKAEMEKGFKVRETAFRKASKRE